MSSLWGGLEEMREGTAAYLIRCPHWRLRAVIGYSHGGSDPGGPGHSDETGRAVSGTSNKTRTIPESESQHGSRGLHRTLNGLVSISKVDQQKFKRSSGIRMAWFIQRIYRYSLFVLIHI